MQQPFSTIKALSMLFLSLLVGQLMFATIAFYLVYSKSFNAVFSTNELIYRVAATVVGLSLLLVAAAFILYKKKVENIRTNAESTSQKLTAYRAASIIRWAMLEAPVLLGIICFILTANYNFLWLTAAILMVFIYTKPSAAKVMQELAMSRDEVET